MTNSYQRTQRGQKRDWLPRISQGDLTGCNLYGWYSAPDPKALCWLFKNPHRIKDVDDWFHWLSCEPSWWHHMMSTKPRRAQERRLLAKIKSGEIDPEDTVWPSATKPQHYFW